MATTDNRPRKIGTLSIQYTKTGFTVWETAVYPNVQIHKERFKIGPKDDKINVQNGRARAWLAKVGLVS